MNVILKWIAYSLLMPLLSFQKRSNLPHTGAALNHGWRVSVVRTLCGCGLVLVIAWLAYTSNLNLAATGFLELLIVLLVALKAGFGEASVVSVLANGCLDYFFTPPLFSLQISDPRNWIALAVFEIAALVVSRLSAAAQHEASHAMNREQEIQKLYNFSNELLRLSRSQQPGSQVLALMQRIFDVEAIVLFDSNNASVERLGQNIEQLEAETRSAYLTGADLSAPTNGRWIRILRTGSLSSGSIGFRGKGLTEITVNALASLVAVALERSRSFEKESQAEAVRKSEQLRTAVLDALAHAYKTPLTAILTSSSGLLEIGQMLPFQEELISLINSQALRLNDLTGRLLRMSRLDSEEVRPQLQRVHTDDLIQATLSSMQSMLTAHPVHVEGLASGTYVEADPELVGMVLAQFLDNASKYSEPNTPITVSVALTPTEVHIGVHSRGSFISPQDREKIFERFYRSPEARSKADGTGIGLSVSKKIANALHGRVWVTSEEDSGSTFSLALLRLPPASSPANR